MRESTGTTAGSGTGTVDVDVDVDVEERIEREREPVRHVSAGAGSPVIGKRGGVGFVVDVGIVVGGGGVVVSVAGGEVGRRHEDDGRVRRVDGFGGDAGEGVGCGTAGEAAVVRVWIAAAVGVAGVHVRSRALVLGIGPRGVVGAGRWHWGTAAAWNVVVVAWVIIVVGC